MINLIIALSLLAVKSQAADLTQYSIPETESARNAMIKACVANPAAYINIGPQKAVPPVLGIIQDKSLFASLCETAIKTGNLDEAKKQLLAKEAGVVLTKKGFSENAAATNKSENPTLIRSEMAESKNRNATLKGRMFLEDQNDILYGDDSNASETLDPSDKTARDADMQRLASLAKRRSTLEEAINCPLAGSTDYEKIYENEFYPLIQSKKYYQEEVTYYYSKLASLSKFVADINSIRSYHSEVDAMRDGGVSTKITYQTVSVESYKPTKKSDGSVEQVKVPVTNEIQVISATVVPSLFSDFESKWGNRYTDYVGSPNFVAQVDLLSLIQDCPPAELMKGFDRNLPNYESERSQRINKCEAVAVNTAAVKSLFVETLGSFKTNLLGLVSTKDAILTLRSKYAEAPVLFDPKRPTAIIEQETRKCQEKLSLAEMSELKARLGAVDAEYKEFIREKRLRRQAETDKQNAAIRESQEADNKKYIYATQRAKVNSRASDEMGAPSLMSR